MRAILLLFALLLTGCGPLETWLPAFGPASVTPTPMTDAGTRYVVIGPAPANARVEPVTIGPVFARLEPGETVTVVATIVGQWVGGSDRWHVVALEGRRLYVHSSLLQRQDSE